MNAELFYLIGHLMKMSYEGFCLKSHGIYFPNLLISENR